MKQALGRLAVNKASTKMVLGASLVALCVILASLWFKEPQELPSTPRLAYEQMIKAMRQKDERVLKGLATRNVVNQLAFYQGQNASQIYVYDFLIEKKSIDPELFKEPWGLWQQWAKTVDLKKFKVTRHDDYWSLQRPPIERYAVSSGISNPVESDSIHFYFEKRSNGWLLTKMTTAAGAAFKG